MVFEVPVGFMQRSWARLLVLCSTYRIMGDSNVSIEFGFLAIALLFIAFWGKPDLIDALIHYFMQGCSC